MPRPLIGITSSTGDGRTTRIEKVGRGYVEAVAAAGGVPVVLATVPAALAADAAAHLDGLLLTGGGDVEPDRYGAVAEPETGGVDLARDAWELELIGQAGARGLPILAICRGIQVLNVARGGTLVQHLAPELGHDDEARCDDEVQEIEVVPGSTLHAVVGTDRLGANTLHHQAVGEVGAGLVVSARSADGVIEAVESVDGTGLGVQWHPELLADRPPHRALFEWLVSRSVADPPTSR